MDGSESWLDWTSVEVSISQPISGSFSHGMEDFLLPDEGVIAEGRPDEDGFKTRRKEPQGRQFSAKGNVTSRLTVPPFKKKPFAGRQRQGFKRHFTGKTIEERKALRDAKKCYICEEEGHFANECPQRNSQSKDDKSDRKGKKPKPSAGLVPDLVGEQQNVDAMELWRAWGKVRDQEVLVFFDPGAHANFISPELASKLGIRAEEMGMTGEAGLACPGHSEAVTPILGKPRLHIQSYLDAEEFHIMPLQDCDVLLGIPWCYRLHAVVDTFHKKITLVHRGKTHVLDVKLKGESVPVVSSYAISFVIKNHLSAYLVFAKEVHEVESNLFKLDKDRAAFLNGFSDCFSDSLPDEQPPERPEDHRIDVVPGSSPPNRPPYRVSAAQQKEIMSQGRGVVLVNLDIAGTLLVTNYRLLFVSEGQRKVVPLGTIPVATIEKFGKQPQPLLRTSQAPRPREKATLQRLLQVVGKDMRIILFGFRPRTRQRRAVWESLMRVTKPARLWDLYAFTSSSSTFKNTDPRVRLHAEYLRLLHLPSSRKAYGSFISDGVGLTDSTLCWRICEANSSFTLSPTYPPLLIVPSSISDEEVQQAAAFRARARLPVVSWRHSENGAVLARSSQPLVGIMLNNRSNADERLVHALCFRSKSSDERRKLYIADARPRKNALANGAMGGGSESSSNYFQSEVVFLGIDNIHSMRDSLARLRDYLDTHGAASSDGSSSLLRSGGLAWGGGNLSNMAAAVSALGDSGWLVHVHNVLAAAAWVAARIALEGASVLVHCSDGWDRTTQIVALAELMLDPYYRTFRGFQMILKVVDWNPSYFLVPEEEVPPEASEGVTCNSKIVENFAVSEDSVEDALKECCEARREETANILLNP
ncbi:hypothetical protein L7F22_051535 [Adiantum nelumboides]|nr:hypothetical protein [Adiantum nelumboides]